METLKRELVAKYRWSADAVDFWHQHGFCCGYCRLYLFSSLDAYRSGQMDHLLPKARYPTLVGDAKNLVLTCQVCNFLKGRMDINEWEGPRIYDGNGFLGEDQRKELLVRCRRYVEQQRIDKSRELLEMRELLLAFCQRQHAAQPF